MVCGFWLAGSRYDERRSRSNARLAFTGTAKQRSSGSQVQLRITLREERDDGQHIGRIWIPTRVCLRVTKERQRSTRFGEGSSRSEKDHGGSASSALKKAPVSEVRRIAIG
jgi:hypothetical protein